MAKNGGWAERLAEQEKTLQQVLPLVAKAVHWHPAVATRLIEAIARGGDGGAAGEASAGVAC